VPFIDWKDKEKPPGAIWFWHIFKYRGFKVAFPFGFIGYRHYKASIYTEIRLWIVLFSWFTEKDWRKYFTKEHMNKMSWFRSWCSAKAKTGEMEVDRGGV
jgi:hypothetical protein